MVVLGEVVPDFKADTTEGEITFHDWIGDKWAILFSHPADFTPVCTTELAKVDEMVEDFRIRDVKLIALSCDSVESHKKWSEDVISYKGGQQKEKELKFPIIADEKRDLAVTFGMVDPDEKDKAGLPLTCRAVFVIGPDKKLKASILYPATTGRNFYEIVRLVESLQLTARQKVATPANWNVKNSNDEVMVVPTLSAEEAKKVFPEHRTLEVPSGKSYLRMTNVDLSTK